MEIKIRKDRIGHEQSWELSPCCVLAGVETVHKHDQLFTALVLAVPLAELFGWRATQ